MSSVVEAFEGVEVFSIDLALQLFGDAVREFVVFLNPLPSFSVLDGHGGDSCRVRCLQSSVGIHSVIVKYGTV